MRLLLIEDNPRLGELIADGLTVHGFAVDHCRTIASGHRTRALVAYDLILLDLGLPDGDGLDFIRRLRGAGDSTPVLVLTARGGLNDRLSGLDGGADDYLVKPFDLAELAARCRALLRRPGSCLGVVLQLGNVALHTATRTAAVGGRSIEAGPRELALLEHLLRRSGQMVTRSQLEQSLYSMGDEVTSNALERTVSRLRKRLTAANAEVTLITARGIGYSLIEPGPRR